MGWLARCAASGGLVLTLAACGSGGEGGGSAGAGGSGGSAGTPGWVLHWEATDQPRHAEEQYLIVLGPKHYLLVQKFDSEANNPTGSGVFRSVEISPDLQQQAVGLAQPNAEVLWYGGYAGGAGVVMQDGDLVVSHHYDGTAWTRSELASTVDAQVAVGTAVADGSPRVALGYEASSNVIELFAAAGASWSKQSLSIGVENDVGAVGEDHAGRVLLVTEQQTNETHHTFSGTQEIDAATAPPRTGSPYILIHPDDSVRYFTANTTFDDYTGLISVLGSDGAWAEYDVPFPGLGREHGLFDGDLEFLWKHNSDVSLYVCRRGQEPWAEIAIKDSGLPGYSPDDLKRDGDTLVVATRANTDNRLMIKSLSECRVQ